MTRNLNQATKTDIEDARRVLSSLHYQEDDQDTRDALWLAMCCLMYCEQEAPDMDPTP